MAAPYTSTAYSTRLESRKEPSVPATKSSSPYHPLFSLPTADLVLRSLEGTLYRLHSFTLRSTSAFFDTMFSLPQPSLHHDRRSDPGHTKSEDILDVYENDFPMERLLSLMSGFPVPKWESFDEVERVFHLAEKWDTPGPLSTLRCALASPQFLQNHALQCYVLAMHFGWRSEAKVVSTHTLHLNLYDPEHADILDQLSSKDLLPLLNLHRKRRDIFRDLLNSPERFTAGNRLDPILAHWLLFTKDPSNSAPYHCSRCGVTELNNHTWKEFKNRMFREMERRPLGDTLGLAVGDAAEWPETLACWEARCTKEGCGGLHYDRIATLRQIRACISLLPATIED